MELSDLDWGNVPAWLSAFSLLLAFAVFLRDRGNVERTQADLVGAWATASYQRRAPWDSPRIEEGEVTAFLRNASQLPVRVARVSWRVESRWSVADVAQSHTTEGGVDAWSIKPGVVSQNNFHDDVRVPLQETIEMPFAVNVGHMAPEGASQLDPLKGIQVHVNWLLLVDNAGRRWEVRLEEGGRAKRVRRFLWKPEAHMSRHW